MDIMRRFSQACIANIIDRGDNVLK